VTVETENLVLVRQKILLAILNQSKRAPTVTKLVKLAFLIRKETTLHDDHTYYDFVPYKYGPFSFALYRELDALERYGYIDSSNDRVSLSPAMQIPSTEKVEELPTRIRSMVTDVVSQYGATQQRRLLKFVYDNYPWYTINSELRDLVPENAPSRQKARIAVYTSGYEGISVDRFFDNLLRSGIEVIIDVRSNPVSRKYGFARKSLNEISAKLGLGYYHLPELGISSENRVALDDYDSYQRLLNRYEKSMLPRQQPAIKRLIQLIKERPSTLLCMEEDVDCCHRGRLAKEVARRTELPIVHLPTSLAK
jgi:uncharacterized protein (DUF488 family)